MSEESLIELVPNKITLYQIKGGGEEVCNISTYNGKLQIGVLPKYVAGQPFKPLYSQGFTIAGIVIMKNYIAKLKSATPGAKFPIVVEDWDKEQRKYVQQSSIIFGKDDKNVCFLEVHFDGRAMRFEFMLRRLAVGSDPMDKAAKSAVGLVELEEYLTHYAPLEMTIGRRKYTRGGNNAATSNNTAPSAGPTSTASFTGESAVF